MAKIVPSYTGTLRSHSLMLPACISECSGIRIFGRRIKSLAFSTDVAIIKNINADAIIATGGPTEESILRTIRAGANAVAYTLPVTGALFSQIMNRYRESGQESENLDGETVYHAGEAVPAGSAAGNFSKRRGCHAARPETS